MSTAGKRGSTLKAINISGRLVVDTDSPAETDAVARRLGQRLSGGTCVALYGELGSGKTAFARGLIHGNGVTESAAVTSPTFVIISEYEGRVPIHHIDAYRLTGAGDMVELGSRELFFSEAASIIEWADRVLEALPDDRLDAAFTVTGETCRRIEISATGEAHGAILAQLARELEETGAIG